MRRVKAACVCQTLHFILKDDIEHAHAARLVKEEVAQYKRALIRNHTPHKIVDEELQPDGSIIVKIIKQYNSSPIGNYLDELI